MPEIPPGLYISQEDWSLHRQGRKDEARHDEKIKEVIRDQLPRIISDGDIITADPETKRNVRIPLRSLELPKFQFGDNSEGVGSGDGEEGDIFGVTPGTGDKNKGAGKDKGEPFYETEFTVEELKELVFADLGLPNLQPKKTQLIPTEDIVFDNRRKKHTASNIDIRQTLLANMKRNAKEQGVARIGDISTEDFRVKTFREKMREENNAVVIFMMDRSGSMGEDETYLARAVCWWTAEFLRSKYPKVEKVFIVHESEANEVDNEPDFFKQGSSGGTICSSANELALKIIKDRYPADLYNIYTLHLSDGDNYANDNQKCVNLVKELLELGINQYGYVQIGGTVPATMFGAFIPNENYLLGQYRKHIRDDRFNGIHIRSRSDVWPALKTLFKPDGS